MKLRKQDQAVVIEWKPRGSVDHAAGPDQELLLELARALGRLAARQDVASSRQARREDDSVPDRGVPPVDLGNRKRDVVH